MQIIKKNFELVRHAQNIVNISNVKKYEINDWYRKIYNIFELLDSGFKHDGRKTINKIIQNEKLTKNIFDIIIFPESIPEYHLPGCLNINDKKQLINIGFYQINDISISKPSAKALYSIFLYNYILYKIHTKKIKFPIDISQNIINYYTAMFISMFGKQYGMIGIYTAKIPKLKFFIACYVLSSYFGMKGKDLFFKAQSYSTFAFNNISDLEKYDFSNVNDFVKTLSDYDIFPGFNVYKMIGKFYTSFGISFLAAFEDFGRFIALISVCTISGNGIAPAFISKYNKQVFNNLMKSIRIIYN
jgi:hypothetical protein